MLKLLKKIIKYSYLKYKYNKSVHFSFNNSISLKSTFEGMNKLYPYVAFDGHLGYGSYISNYSNISAHVGRFTSIAPYVEINAGAHPYTYPYVTTSPAFFSTQKQNGSTFTKEQLFDEFRYADPVKKIPVIIGNDCWIGQRVFIAGGVTIGDGAVILAGSVVTKDIPAYAIAGGIPARVKKYRYDEDTIRFLLEAKWWNREIDWLKKNSRLLCNIDNLKSVLTKK